MVANINKLNGKIAEKNYTRKRLAEEIGMSELTLRKKITDENSDFYIEESIKLSKVLDLTIVEYLDIFFGEKLEFNS